MANAASSAAYDGARPMRSVESPTQVAPKASNTRRDRTSMSNAAGGSIARATQLST
jgi:hypothetical protein